MSNPRLDNFKVIDDQGFTHLRFAESPWDDNVVEVWGSQYGNYWTLLETF